MELGRRCSVSFLLVCKTCQSCLDMHTISISKILAEFPSQGRAVWAKKWPAASVLSLLHSEDG